MHTYEKDRETAVAGQDISGTTFSSFISMSPAEVAHRPFACFQRVSHPKAPQKALTHNVARRHPSSRSWSYVSDSSSRGMINRRLIIIYSKSRKGRALGERKAKSRNEIENGNSKCVGLPPYAEGAWRAGRWGRWSFIFDIQY